MSKIKIKNTKKRKRDISTSVRPICAVPLPISISMDPSLLKTPSFVKIERAQHKLCAKAELTNDCLCGRAENT